MSQPLLPTSGSRMEIVLPVPVYLKTSSPADSGERLAMVDDPLSERMADAVKVGVLDIFPGAIWAGMDVFLGERIAVSTKAFWPSSKLRKRLASSSG